MTAAERELQKLLAIRPLGAAPKYQHPEGRYRIDVFFPGWKLAVEIDGPRHERQVEYDCTRDAQLASMGIAVLRLSSVLLPEQLREHIRYVAQRIAYFGHPAKVKFCVDYSTSLQKKTEDHTLEQVERESFGTASTGNPLCMDCSGSSWKMIPCWNENMRRAEMRATRCRCTNLRPMPEQEEFRLRPDDYLQAVEQKKPQQGILLAFPEKQVNHG